MLSAVDPHLLPVLQSLEVVKSIKHINLLNLSGRHAQNTCNLVLMTDIVVIAMLLE